MDIKLLRHSERDSQNSPTCRTEEGYLRLRCASAEWPLVSWPSRIHASVYVKYSDGPGVLDPPPGRHLGPDVPRTVTVVPREAVCTFHGHCCSHSDKQLALCAIPSIAAVGSCCGHTRVQETGTVAPAFGQCQQHRPYSANEQSRGRIRESAQPTNTRRHCCMRM